ncbi:MAG: HDIG domain-containing protein [Ignavibacteria bacterium]|nr:HDIG domain-containing protein [Ignavibacteria bacterium]
MSFLEKINLLQKSKIDLTNDIYVKSLIVFITIIIISLLLPNVKNYEVKYEIGTVWTDEDLIAPFTFPIYKDEQEYETEKQKAINSVEPVFTDRTVMSSQYKDSLRLFFQNINKVLFKAKSLDKENDEIINSAELDELKNKIQIQFTKEQWVNLFRLYKSKPIENNTEYQNFISTTDRVIQDLSQNKILNLNKSDIKTPDIFIKTEDQKILKSESLTRVYDRTEITNIISERLNVLMENPFIRGITSEIARYFIKENLIYDKNLTELETESRVDQIPKTIGIVMENERIVSKHDPITKETKLKLESFKKVRLTRIGVQDYFLQFLGKLLLVLILLFVFGIFLKIIRRDIFSDNSKLLLISSIIILISLFSYISLHLNIKYPVELLIFVSVASILLTIIFDSRLAFFAIIIICFLVSSVRGGDYTLLFISFCGGTLAIFSVRDIKNRTQIFRSFYFILFGYLIPILAFGLDRSDTTSKIATEMIFGGVNAIISPILAYGLLIFYERVFKITTDLTLLELADFNHPLLKELSAKAPGTFHHSVVMGNLAEAAAEAVGANRILARVGCYYHDIGKINKPEYFIENQLERINRHENLTPNISVKLIISHVKDGIELAKKYKLPKEVIDFIPMHHGTNLVSYFYNKAKNLVDEDKEDIHDYIYRYPGPKPNTRETAIAMLADTIEASTRTIEDPTPGKLEDKIDEIINKRLVDGELDNCDLTLKDLTKIKLAFLKILVGIHHQRIKYPEQSNN